MESQPLNSKLNLLLSVVLFATTLVLGFVFPFFQFIDQATYQFFLTHASAEMLKILKVITFFGEGPVLYILGVLLAAWRWKKSVQQAILLALVTPMGMLANYGLKLFFSRPRPASIDPLMIFVTHSYPSGHAFGAMVFYGLLLLMFVSKTNRVFWIMGAVAIFCIGLSRIALGVHWVTDVTGGFLFGMSYLGFLKKYVSP